jgi:bifunctional DNase/RNase
MKVRPARRSGGDTARVRRYLLLATDHLSMSYTAEVEGVGSGLGADGERVPAVLLRANGRYLPIFVTNDQADSIRLALDGETFDRPLTHDLLVQMVTEFGGAFDRVRIDDLEEGVFYAKIDTERYEDGQAESVVFDARPSDAIALAVRADCDIEISEAVLEAAGRNPEELDMGEGF